MAKKSAEIIALQRWYLFVRVEVPVGQVLTVTAKIMFSVGPFSTDAKMDDWLGGFLDDAAAHDVNVLRVRAKTVPASGQMFEADFKATDSSWDVAEGLREFVWERACRRSAERLLRREARRQSTH